MLKFTKLSESASKIIYDIMNGVLGTAEYDKKTSSVRFFDENGKEFYSERYKIAFSYIIKNNFPESYTYAFC